MITRTNRFALSLLLVTLVILLCACVRGERVPREGEATEEMFQRFATGMMKASDLPPGWGHRRVLIEDELGGVGRTVVYSADNPREPYLSVSQMIVLYPDKESGREGYLRVMDATIPPAHADEWFWPEELRIQMHADETRVGCLSLSVNGTPCQTCCVIARYGDAVMTIYGNIFETDWITMPEFRLTLQRVDERMESTRLAP